MEITHKTLAVLSGVALIVIVGVNTSVQSNKIAVVTEDSLQFATTTNDTSTALTADLKSGVSMDLRNKNLEIVPTLVFKRTKTETLDISHNNLTGAMPAEIRHLSELVELNLSHNNFIGVPAEIGQLSKLQILDLSYNNLTGLPLELGNLKALKVLDLRGNANYSEHDLSIIQESLAPSVRILVD